MEREEQVDVVVEIPRGRRNKYEVDHERGVVRLSRRVFAPVAFPADYGYIEGAVGSDGDELDALVLLNEETYPGVWVSARVIGALQLKIGDRIEHKVVTVAVSDPVHDTTHELGDLAPSVVTELEAFFEMYRKLEEGDSPEVVARLEADAAQRLVADRRR